MSSILSVDRFAVEDVAGLYHELEQSHSGRLVVGLGGAHGERPLATLEGYLDRLDALGVPTARIVLAALGPKMADLARRRASAALPVLVTPDYTSGLRQQLGDDVGLFVSQVVVADTDAPRARSAARGMLGMMGQSPAYRTNWRRLGFDDDDIEQLSDALVDRLVAWGEADAIAGRVAEQLSAGADHVAVLAIGDTSPDAWAALAEHML
jgi:probable F420-dependent oxidoreductase